MVKLQEGEIETMQRFYIERNGQTTEVVMPDLPAGYVESLRDAASTVTNLQLTQEDLDQSRAALRFHGAATLHDEHSTGNG